MVAQLRLIGLCNVVYKGITKTIMNRLKPLLGRVIALTQASFVPIDKLRKTLSLSRKCFTQWDVSKVQKAAWLSKSTLRMHTIASGGHLCRNPFLTLASHFGLLRLSWAAWKALYSMFYGMERKLNLSSHLEEFVKGTTLYPYISSLYALKDSVTLLMEQFSKKIGSPSLQVEGVLYCLIFFLQTTSSYLEKQQRYKLALLSDVLIDFILPPVRS